MLASDVKSPANKPTSIPIKTTQSKVTIQIIPSVLLNFQNFKRAFACMSIPFKATCKKLKLIENQNELINLHNNIKRFITSNKTLSYHNYGS